MLFLIQFYFEANLHIIISQLLRSVCLCPQVIPLSSLHCTLKGVKNVLTLILGRSVSIESIGKYRSLNANDQAINVTVTVAHRHGGPYFLDKISRGDTILCIIPFLKKKKKNSLGGSYVTPPNPSHPRPSRPHQLTPGLHL